MKSNRSMCLAGSGWLPGGGASVSLALLVCVLSAQAPALASADLARKWEHAASCRIVGIVDTDIATGKSGPPPFSREYNPTTIKVRWTRKPELTYRVYGRGPILAASFELAGEDGAFLGGGGAGPVVQDNESAMAFTYSTGEEIGHLTILREGTAKGRVVVSETRPSDSFGSRPRTRRYTGTCR